VLAFWGKPGEERFSFSVDIYVCESQRRYWHLVMNNAPASASGGDIFIVSGYPEEALTAFLRHELMHAHVVHEFGWLRNLLRVPAWLDEGLATSIQGTEWSDEAGLARFTARTRELASLGSTPNVLRWRGAVDGSGDLAGGQYAYARGFTEDLMARHGRETVLAFLREAVRTGDQEASFSRAFGGSLAEAEREWLAARSESGVLPAGLKLVDRGLPVALTVKMVIAAAVVLLLLAWSLRQLCRIARWTGRLVSADPPPRPRGLM
jgi:hypothetical protein